MSSILPLPSLRARLVQDPAGFALASIGALFLLKYGMRLHPAVGIAAMFVYPLLWFLRPFCPDLKKWGWITAALGLAGFWLLVWWKIPPAHIMVDRWDAVTCWWDAAFAGHYPYSARTRFDGFPSPLPILQLLYLPGYLLGDIGWVTVALLLAFGAVLRKRFPTASADLLLWGPGFVPLLWEVAVRSTLVVNALLFLGWILLANARRAPALLGSLAGLLLGMRLNFAIPMLVQGIAEWRSSHGRTLRIGAIAIAVTTAIFSILIYAYGLDAFLANNPIRHHGRHASAPFMAVVLAAGILWAWFRGHDRASLFDGICAVMLSFGTLHLVWVSLEFGFYETIFGNKGDLSYLLFAWPFLVWKTLRH